MSPLHCTRHLCYEINLFCYIFVLLQSPSCSCSRAMHTHCIYDHFLSTPVSVHHTRMLQDGALSPKCYACDIDHLLHTYRCFFQASEQVVVLHVEHIFIFELCVNVKATLPRQHAFLHLLFPADESIAGGILGHADSR